MKLVFTYSLSLLMLLTFLVNSQGIMVEHHDCNSCDSGVCEMGETEMHHLGCDDGEPCCGSHDFETHQHEDVCDLYDFSDPEHQSSCSCFAEYFQLPVFQSEIKTYKVVPTPTVCVCSLFLNNNFQNISKELYSVGYHAPPDKQYQDLSLNILNCTFLC